MNLNKQAYEFVDESYRPAKTLRAVLRSYGQTGNLPTASQHFLASRPPTSQAQQQYFLIFQQKTGNLNCESTNSHFYLDPPFLGNLLL